VPTYQYACLDCAEEFEVRQSFADPALTECPACEGRLRKVFNAVGIVFKGSGFYRTDSRASANGETAKANGSPETSKDTAGDKSSSETEKPGKAGEHATSYSPSSKRTEKAASSSSSAT
jgi:putative FmdB family regulatory protein